MSVTAIVPVRNMSNLLPRALDSLRKQTVPLAEIIVADDASTENIEEIAADYGCTYVRNPGPENWGICGGRNEAFKHVKTEFTLPLDADDWIEPTYVEETLTLMANQRVGIVSTYFMYHEGREGTVMMGPPQTYATELEANNITVCSLVRTEAIRQAGPWDHNLRGWEDWDMWLRILKLGWKHRVVPEVLFHYRLHNSGMNAWANQPENKQKLYGYLLSKHPDFGMIRSGGGRWNGI